MLMEVNILFVQKLTFMVILFLLSMEFFCHPRLILYHIMHGLLLKDHDRSCYQAIESHH